MPNISFASGGDGETDTLDYVAYVAKDGQVLLRLLIILLVLPILLFLLLILLLLLHVVLPLLLLLLDCDFHRPVPCPGRQGLLCPGVWRRPGPGCHHYRGTGPQIASGLELLSWFYTKVQYHLQWNQQTKVKTNGEVLVLIDLVFSINCIASFMFFIFQAFELRFKEFLSHKKGSGHRPPPLPSLPRYYYYF